MPSFVDKVFRLIRTVRFLKLQQLSNRFTRKLTRPNVSRISRSTLARRSGLEAITFLETEVSVLSEKQFRFLNKKETLVFPKDWDNLTMPILWRYNLHYFNGLLAATPNTSVKQNMVLRWVEENSEGKGVGWDPYPLSLRIVNLIKWLIASDINNSIILSSLCTQVRVLMGTLEYHLLGNHLIENAKALIFAGTFFEGPEADQWLAAGLAIMNKQLPEQVLKDGGHFELSTMYQGIMLECVLDILLLAKTKSAPDLLSARESFFSTYAIRMANWLAAMVHPDNKIAFFNDASHGIAHSPQVLFEQVKRLTGWENPGFPMLHSMLASGYHRVSIDKLFFILDAADVGARYLAGHGHADTLSFEMSFSGERLFVNVGTSEYGLGEQRAYERSTAAHNTLELEGKDSSEVWGGFRVGRRARVQDMRAVESEGSVDLKASHTGYMYINHNAIHSRSLMARNHTVMIEDSVGYGEGVVRFHLHPSIRYEVGEGGCEGSFLLRDGTAMAWSADAKAVYTETFMYAPGFGVLQPSTVLCLVCNQDQNSKLTLNWN